LSKHGHVCAGADLGDFVVSMAVARNLHAFTGDKQVIHAVETIGVQPFLKRVPLIEELVLAQPYIAGLELGTKKGIDITGFRRFHSRNQSLLYAQSMELNSQFPTPVTYSDSPWLTIPSKSSYSPGRVLLCRTERYRSNHFPWREILEHLRDRALFIGLPHEHQNFQKMFGFVEFCPTRNLMEVAQLIAASELLISNQTSAANISLGMGHPTIVELWCVSSCDVIYQRQNAEYSFDGSVTIDGKIIRSSVPKDQIPSPLIPIEAILNSKLPFPI